MKATRVAIKRESRIKVIGKGVWMCGCVDVDCEWLTWNWNFDVTGLRMWFDVFASARYINRFRKVRVRIQVEGGPRSYTGHPNLRAYVAMRTSKDHGITRVPDWSD